ncbi:hypothetical protein XM53_14250 [Roseovarius atlanticus]|uniref:Aminotransferase n=1 Tax=Roseovarius atlanticus TaxID=1641875 RepID=A0A0T5NSX8_9RHOB|nr:hypothetical protein [Roseovarius atlanticus]KRS11854.1 hypothetical protein XM53_14250 [Roseovarius atlanticus]
MTLADDHNSRLETLIDADRRHHLHPWEDLATWQEAKRFTVTHGEGIHIFDDKGRKYIDGPAGMWAVQIGYGRTEMAEACFS